MHPLFRRLAPALVGLLPVFVAPAEAAFRLERIAGVSLSGAEIAAFDPSTNRAFAVSGTSGFLRIADLSDPYAPLALPSVSLAGYGGNPNSVAFHSGLVAVSIDAAVAQDPGKVVFFDVDGTELAQVNVGAIPDMVTFTPDGSRLLVANEGEPKSDYTIDPEGSVSIIDLSGGVGSASVTTVEFDDFNVGGPREAELPADVRIFGPGATVAQDLEPEYIAISADGATAFVTLQENNAVAVIDIANASVTRIDALGFKDHSLAGNALDTSDSDGIDIANKPLFGMYLPDAIATTSHLGTPYYLTANEGDARDYTAFKEEKRISTLTLDPAVFPNAATLKTNAEMGRVNVTNTLGNIDMDADFDALYAFGARSFSVWNGSDGSLVFDSGDDFEMVTAAEIPTLFNSEANDPAEFDKRSDNKGPEPEGIAVGSHAGSTFAFISMERAGGMMLYDITDPTAPVFADYERFGADLNPEGVAFVPAADSPGPWPMVLVSNEASGNLAVYALLDCADDSDADADGVAACADLCPADAAKLAPGDCGCGEIDTDSDSDGAADCIDECPADSAKTVEGVCGCGNPDTDGDGDMVADCVDGCPGDGDKVTSCLDGACPAAPLSACLAPLSGKTGLKMKKFSDPAKDNALLKWFAADATTPATFLSPSTAAHTSWCVYDNGSLVVEVQVAPDAVCNGKPCWKETGKGFLFKDKSGSVGGVTLIKLVSGKAGKGQVQVNALGKTGEWTTPSLPFATPVVSQVIVDDGTTRNCFEASFATADKNDGSSFDAVAP